MERVDIVWKDESDPRSSLNPGEDFLLRSCNYGQGLYNLVVVSRGGHTLYDGV
jgi:hypothetical protein